VGIDDVAAGLNNMLVGFAVGETTGAKDGEGVVGTVGINAGLVVGDSDVGKIVGTQTGLFVGETVGAFVGGKAFATVGGEVFTEVGAVFNETGGCVAVGNSSSFRE